MGLKAAAIQSGDAGALSPDVSEPLYCPGGDGSYPGSPFDASPSKSVLLCYVTPNPSVACSPLPFLIMPMSEPVCKALTEGGVGPDPGSGEENIICSCTLPSNCDPDTAHPACISCGSTMADLCSDPDCSFCTGRGYQ